MSNTPNPTWLVRQQAPFVATAVLAWIVVLVGESIDWTQYAVSVVLLLGLWSLALVTVMRGHARAGTVAGSIGFLAAVGLLRNAGGGSSTGISMLSLLAVFQTALFLRGRRELTIVLVAVAAFYLIPILAVGPPEYPHNGYRGALLAVTVSSIIGLVTQQLVADIRSRAAEARRRELMLVEVNTTVHRLFESPSARNAVCQAVRDISGATLGTIYEAVGGSDVLECTATTVIGVEIHGPAAPGSTVYDAFSSGESILITDASEARVGNVAMWTAGGRPTSLLYEPLRKGDTPIGVLITGWPDVVDPDEPRVVTASLLAHEAAAVIDRADAIHQLTGEAHTDPLTSLPNRRAWDARLALAISERRPLAVAMIDIDHFKRFNDAHGHPEGDRLLQEAAAAWRAELRTGDFLARLGGEEFALLMQEIDANLIHDIVQRLRNLMPDRQTCSAGIAFRALGETAEQLIARADQALYEAKTGGRNRIEVSYGRSLQT